MSKKYEDILKMDAQKYGYKIKSEERLKVLAGKFKIFFSRKSLGQPFEVPPESLQPKFYVPA